MILIVLLIIAAIIALPFWANVRIVRMLRNSSDTAGWWIVLVLLWLAGATLGVYATFYFEYFAEPTLRVHGAPLPVLIQQQQGPPGKTQWIPFPANTGLLNIAYNVLLLALLSAIPLGVAFWWRRKLSQRQIM